MRLSLALATSVVCLTCHGLATDYVNIAEDDANQPMYNGGWNDGSGNDNGFMGWKIVSKNDGDGSFAGHFLANKGERPELEILTTNRAFALFANGRGFEEVVAYRAISLALEVNDNFSLSMLHGPFGKKGEVDDPAPARVGFALRTGNQNTSVEDYNAAARFEFLAKEGAPNYLIHDAEGDFDTGIPVTADGLGITLSLLTADTYDLEVINLKDKSKKVFKNRKLGGTAGAPVQSLALFNMDSEAHDVFFNNFQVSRLVD